MDIQATATSSVLEVIFKIFTDALPVNFIYSLLALLFVIGLFYVIFRRWL
jgi:hypothetical protein